MKKLIPLLAVAVLACLVMGATWLNPKLPTDRTIWVATNEVFSPSQTFMASTNMMAPGVGTTNIQNSWFKAGRAIRVRARGVVQIAGGGSNFGMQIRLGSQSFWLQDFNGCGNLLGEYAWELQFDIRTISGGSNGRLQGFGSVHWPDDTSTGGVGQPVWDMIPLATALKSYTLSGTGSQGLLLFAHNNDPAADVCHITVRSMSIHLEAP